MNTFITSKPSLISCLTALGFTGYPTTIRVNMSVYFNRDSARVTTLENMDLTLYRFMLMEACNLTMWLSLIPHLPFI